VEIQVLLNSEKNW